MKANSKNERKTIKKLPLIIEKSRDGKWWGRVKFKNDLIVDSADSPDELEKKMKNLLRRFYNIQPLEIKFQRAYDLSALFVQKDYLNVPVIALKAGISPGLMRQYTAGLKYPSLERAKTIERIIKELGRELMEVRVEVSKSRPITQSPVISFQK